MSKEHLSLKQIMLSLNGQKQTTIKVSNLETKDNKNTKVLRIYSVILLVISVINFRYSKDRIRNGRAGYGHIRYQRLEINQNRRFVLKFTHILVLTVFRYFFRRHIG